MSEASSLVSRHVADLAPYVPGEQPRDGRLIKLNTNENPYPCSARVREAVAEAAAGALERYPSPMADALRERAGEVYGVSPEQVLAANGSDELLRMILAACVVPGQTIAAPAPTYSLYAVLAEIAGARLVTVDADAAPIPASLADLDARVYFLCSPNAPFGYTYELDDIAAFCRRVDRLVVADEAYVDFADQTALDILADHPNLLVTRSFSKSFSLAGARLGLAFGSVALIGELAKVKDSYNVSRMAMAAGVAALEDMDWMRLHAGRVRATRDATIASLRAMGWSVRDSHTNFFWIDCDTSGGEPVYAHLRGQGILVRYFHTERLRHGIRVSVGTDEQMQAFLEAMATAPR